MKKALPILLLILSSHSVFGQDSSFKIQILGSVYTNEQVLKAFESADLCGMINPDLDYSISFDDGTVVTILSAKSISTDENCVRKSNLTDSSIWFIKEGILIKSVQSSNIKKS